MALKTQVLPLARLELVFDTMLVTLPFHLMSFVICKEMFILMLLIMLMMMMLTLMLMLVLMLMMVMM